MPRSDCHLKARELQHLEAKFEKLKEDDGVRLLARVMYESIIN